MLQSFGMTIALRITWLERNCPNLRRMEDVNSVIKNTLFVCDSITVNL